MRKERELIMETRKSANIGARLDRLPNSGWHIKMWLVTAFALLVCWSNGIGGSVQNILLNELHWLEPGTKAPCNVGNNLYGRTAFRSACRRSYRR